MFELFIIPLDRRSAVGSVKEMALSSCCLFFLGSAAAPVTLYNPGGLFSFFPQRIKGMLESQGSGFVLCTSVPVVGDGRVCWKRNGKLGQGKYVFFCD